VVAGEKHTNTVSHRRSGNTSSWFHPVHATPPGHHPGPGPRQESLGWGPEGRLGQEGGQGWLQGETHGTRFRTAGAETRVPGFTGSRNQPPGHHHQSQTGEPWLGPRGRADQSDQGGSKGETCEPRESTFGVDSHAP